MIQVAMDKNYWSHVLQEGMLWDWNQNYDILDTKWGRFNTTKHDKSIYFEIKSNNHDVLTDDLQGVGISWHHFQIPLSSLFIKLQRH